MTLPGWGGLNAPPIPTDDYQPATKGEDTACSGERDSLQAGTRVLGGIHYY